MADDAPPFPYMRWAKAHLPASDPRSLGLSGLQRPGPDDLSGIEDPFEGGENPEALLPTALAAHEGVESDRVYPTAGASHANFLVWLAFAKGGVTAVETPCYEAFVRLGPAVSAEVNTFRRRAENDWRLDPDDLARACRGDLRLIALTDLHNPSGKRLHPDDLGMAVEIAEREDALVVVDEVYRDLDPRNRPTAALASDRVIVTNSLTKSHGMWDLRAGWVIGAPERIEAVASWDDLVCPRLSILSLREILRFLPHARTRLERTRRRCAEATEQVAAWIGSRDDVWWTRPDAGFTTFLRLGSQEHPLDGDQVCRLAWERSGVRVVPGSFFQMQHWVRVSYLLDSPVRLEESLAGLGDALDHVRV